MKVKGYINEMAVRLEDEDERISNLAKLFFLELSKKGNNPIYNLLPDILSKLSKQNLSNESFCNIMQFLIASIKKDRQMEALVEKLCNRFSGVADVRQWEHISYCLSQLSFTEKGMKKLIDLFKTYEHALSEDSVMDNFKNILNKAKKFAKLELKTYIEEFEEKLTKFHTEKKEQEVTARNAQIHQQKIDSRENFIMDKNSEEYSKSNTSGSDEADGEVIDTCNEEINTLSINGKSKTKPVPQASTSALSELIEPDQVDIEVQSPMVKTRGARSRIKKNIVKEEKGDISITKKRVTRSRR